MSIWTVVLTVGSVVLCQVQWPLTLSNACHSSIRHHHGSRFNPETLPSCCPITTMSRTAITCAYIAHGDVISLYLSDQWGRVAHFSQAGNWKICTFLQICLHSVVRLWILFKTKLKFIPWFRSESYFKTLTFLGAFAKLWKTAISFVSVCPSVRLCDRREQLDSHWTDFLKFDIRGFLENLSV